MVIVVVIMRFHINQLNMVNGNVLYIVTEYVKYESWMKTSSITPPRHIITCPVQFSGVLVQQHYIKTESSPICTCLPQTEIPLTQGQCQIEAVYFKNKFFFLARKVSCVLELQPIHSLFFPTFFIIAIVTTPKVSQNTCFFCSVNYYFNTLEDGNG
jgi:hypothetical protein